MLPINAIRDEKTGRFQTITDTTRYKNVYFNGKRMAEHARVLCMALDIPQIPKGLIVHHLDENKKNNDIDNLALITITAHNRIHSHEPWNKGVTAENNGKWANTVNKQREARDKSYEKKFKETYELQQTGKTYLEVANILGIKEGTVNFRIRRYKQLNLKQDE